MNGVGNELVVKAKRERPRIFVAMPNTSIVPPQKNRGRPRGCGTKQRLVDVDDKGNVDMNETIDDIEKRITNLKNLFHGLKDKRIWKKVSETENDDVEDNDTEDDDDDYEVGSRGSMTQKKIASEIKRPNSAINKPKSEVRITYCILGLRAPKSVVGCSSSKRVKWADGFAPKRKSGK
ncbi:hypothetical protein Tco_1261837 [Tanacetum coccineum]